MIARIGILIAAAGLLAGCAPASEEGGFDSANPAAQLYAIRDAGVSRDRTKIPALIEQLESDDPAVRLLSIQALERITGTRLGYNYFAPSHERAKAVQGWVEAYESGRFDKPTSGSSGGKAARKP